MSKILTREEMLARFVLIAEATPVSAEEAALLEARLNQASRDYPSIVGIYFPEEKYTDEELSELAEFADEVTHDFIKRYNSLRGPNLYLFDKFEGAKGEVWWRTRMGSWNYYEFFRDLEAALFYMKQIAKKLVTRRFTA